MIERAENDKYGHVQWMCQCDCGQEVFVVTGALKSGRTRSCGCLHREMVKERATKHGQRTTRLYRIWCSIKRRTSVEADSGYYKYGGRGITVCKEWKDSFEAFRDWALANGYRDDLTIDRINNEQGYFPENCRWATEIEQANNKRNNHLLTFAGETHTIAEWARIKKVSSDLIRNRLNLGWSVEQALTEPTHKQNRKKK